MNDIICFQTDGHIEDFAIESFGISAKRTDNPIGKFGTGLKYAIAITLRSGGKVTLWRGLESTRFTTKEARVRDTTVDMVMLGDKQLPFSTHLGSSWESWMPFREMYANTLDEGGEVGTLEDLFPTEGATTFEFECPLMTDAYNNRDELFIPKDREIVFECDEFTAFKGKSMFLYYNGVRAYNLLKPSLHTYSFYNIELTEDRTIKTEYSAKSRLSDYYSRKANPTEIEKMFDHAENGFEQDLAFAYNMGDVLKGVVDSRLDKRKYVTPNAQRAFDLVLSPIERLNRIPDVTPTDEQEADLLIALDIVRKIGFGIERERVVVKEKLISGASIAAAGNICFIHSHLLGHRTLTRDLLHVAIAIPDNEQIFDSPVLNKALDIIINNHKNDWTL